MFRLVKLGLVIVTVVAVAAVSLMSGNAATNQSRLGVGELAGLEEISRWDIDIRPDGQGLPPGQGNVLQGEALFAKSCAQCHGEFGEGLGNYPVLVGGDKNDLETASGPKRQSAAFGHMPRPCLTISAAPCRSGTRNL